MLLPLPPAKQSTDWPIISLPVPPIKNKSRIQLPPASQTLEPPKKRARVVGPGFSRKRTRPDVRVASETRQALGSPRTEIPTDLLLENLATEVNSADHDPALFNKEFQFYSRAVFGNSVGLYQICETLWVAQGWTHRSGGNSVCRRQLPRS